MKVEDLKTKTKIDLANPFFFYSIFSLIKTIFIDGKESYELPTLHLGNIYYLPNLRAGLTPFGIEYHFENYFRLNDKISLIDFGLGDHTFYNSWGSIWKQPGILFGNNLSVRGRGIGGAVSIRGYYNFFNQEFPISVVCELGYKSIGFLEGFDLNSSPIISIGFALSN